MALRYDSELMQALGLRVDTKVGYYYMEGDLLMCWTPQSRECVGTEVVRSVYTTLNTYTKEIYSQDSAAQGEVNTYTRKVGCKLVKGGPLDGRCFIGYQQLPGEVLDVLGITDVEVITMPDHDLWELVSEGGTAGGELDTNIYLVTSGRCTVSVSGEDSYYLIKNPRMVYISTSSVCSNDNVVYRGTKEYCLHIQAHLEQAYESGKGYRY